MNSLFKNDEKLMKFLKNMSILIVVINVIIGIAGLILQKDLFFVAESLWVITGFLLLIFHGYPTIGAKAAGGMVIIGCLVSMFYECLGCNFGLFFSKYIYTGYIPGPKVFGFNLYSLIAYGIGCYIIWSTVRSITGQYGTQLKKSDVVFMPILCSLILVTVDYATDPFLSTINHTHIWEKPGVYYGIPWQNYMGWYLMAYTIYLFIALMLYFMGKKNKLPQERPVMKKKAFWIIPPLMYASLWIQMPFYVFIKKVTEVTVESNGQVFTTSQIYWGVMIVMLGAMVTPAVAAIARILKDEHLED